MSFGDVLSQLRWKKRSSDGRKQLSQDELAEAANLSRPYISMLENDPGKKPSIVALAALCRLLATPGDMIHAADQGSDLDFSSVIKLISAALDIDLTSVLEEDFVGLLTQAPPIEEEIWIFTDMLAENQFPAIRDTTIENLPRGVKYRYFISTRYGAEWPRFKETVRKSQLDLDSANVVVVASDSPVCLTRMAIYDPATDHPLGTITTGFPAKQPRLRRLQLDQALGIYNTAQSALRSMVQSGRNEGYDPALGQLRVLFTSRKARV